MPASSRPIREGLIVGGIAYVAVAAFYAAFDLLASRGMGFTVNQLGLAVFRGLRDTGGVGLPVPLDYGAIMLYNGFHLGIALIIGLVVNSLVAHAQQRPERAPSVLVVLIAGFVATIAVVGVATMPLRGVLPWWSIITANTLAVALCTWYVLRRNPTVFRNLTDPAG